MKPRKASWVLLLAFLLLSLQLEARIHPLGHLGERLRAVAEHGAVAGSVAMPCAQCDLLSGTVDGPAASVERTALPAPSRALAPVPVASIAGRTFLPYSSRAPPVLR